MTTTIRPKDLPATASIAVGDEVMLDGATGVRSIAVPDFARLLGKPLFILATGQSNFTQAPALAWTPAPNLLIWNSSGVDGNVGTTFVSPIATTIRTPIKVASDIAKANPGRTVYLINISFSGRDISHWLAGAAAPDVYANIVANISGALAAAGVSTIDLLLWWQGESDAIAASPTYYADWHTMLARFKLLSWFPEETPIAVFGLAPASITGNANYDVINNNLQSIVDVDPERRRLIYTGNLPAGVWGAIPEMTAAGYFTVGAMAANVIMNGGRASIFGLHVHPVTGEGSFNGTLNVGSVGPASGTARFLNLYGAKGTAGGTGIQAVNDATNTWDIGNYSALFGGAYDDSLAFFDVSGKYVFRPAASVTPLANGDLTFQITSNTQLTFKLKGSDGTVRSGSITLT